MNKKSHVELQNLLTEYFVRENCIDINKEYEICTIKARDLIGVERFDIIAKLIYIDAFEKKIDMSHAIKIYSDNINAFSCGTYIEPGTESKNSIDVYIKKFNELIINIRDKGFDENESLIPLGKNNVICDGAHRVAIAAYYNRDVTVVKFPELERNYDYRFFRKYLMSDINMGYMAIQYTHMVSHCFLACLWPVADRSKIDTVTELIRDRGGIIYEQDVYLTYCGTRNFMTQIYGHQAWTGSIEDGFAGVDAKVRCCYQKNNPIHTYLFIGKDLDEIIILKKKIRDLFGLENHSIHISDNQLETEKMAELLYNPNSVDFMNSAKPYEYNNVLKKTDIIKRQIRINKLDINRIIIDSSAVMEVCGIRRAKDIDYLTDDNNIAAVLSSEEDIDVHSSQICYHTVSVKDMLYNPENYFLFNGMKYLSINRLIEMKKKRGESKDLVDVKLMERFVKSFHQLPKAYRYITIDKINSDMIHWRMYGSGGITYTEYKRIKTRKLMVDTLRPLIAFKQFISLSSMAKLIRNNILKKKRNKLKNKTISIIASNCNGGVLCSDLGLPFNSPFVNLFIRAKDFVKLCANLKEYMDMELNFVKEEDEIYGKISYPTAYLGDIKLYFMHYSSVKEAKEAWDRRKKRINWDNIWIIFTDRSGCTLEDLEEFDKLPFEHKVVFTHISYPNIDSAYYIRGYEDCDKVGVLSEFSNNRFPVKRMYEQFDFVRWFNG